MTSSRFLVTATLLLGCSSYPRTNPYDPECDRSQAACARPASAAAGSGGAGGAGTGGVAQGGVGGSGGGGAAGQGPGCASNCLGGACLDGVCQPVTLAKADNSSYVLNLALDDAFVYFGGEYNLLSRIPKSGGTKVVLTTKGGDPRQIVVDNEKVYWTATNMPTPAWWVPKGGGAPTALLMSGGLGAGIFVDAIDVYWSEQLAGTATIYRASKIGGDATAYVQTTGVAPYFTGDADSVYWIETATTVKKMAKAGGAATTLTTLAESAYGLAVGDAAVFAVGGHAWMIDKSAGGATDLGSLGKGSPGSRQGITLDASYVYACAGSTLFRAPIAGGQVAPMATFKTDCGDIAVDDIAVYWGGSGEVARVAK